MAVHFLATTRVGRTRTMIVGLALVATSCGGSSVTAENLSSSITDSTAPAVVDDSSDSAVTDDLGATDTPQDDTVVAPAESRDMTSVLAFAIEASEQESFTFTQGLAINLGAAGVTPPAAGPYAFGEVSEGRTHVRVDLEAFVAESMGSLAGFGLGPGDLTGQQFEVWTDDDALTMDLSKLDVGEFDAVFADGPVSVEAGAASGVDINAVAQQFGQGSQITDPAAMFNALRLVTEAQETGTDIVGDVDVTVYSAMLSVGDYYEAIGSRASDQLSTIESLGLAESEAEAIAELIPMLETLEMDVTIMVDADGRVRRVATDLNVTSIIVALFESSSELSEVEGAATVDIGALFGPDGLQIGLSNWQEFDDYGSAPEITVPDAADVTDQAVELFAND